MTKAKKLKICNIAESDRYSSDACFRGGFDKSDEIN